MRKVFYILLLISFSCSKKSSELYTFFSKKEDILEYFVLNKVNINEYCGYIDVFNTNDKYKLSYKIFVNCHSYKGSLVEEKLVNDNFKSPKVMLGINGLVYNSNFYSNSDYINFLDEINNDGVINLYVEYDDWENAKSLPFFVRKVEEYTKSEKKNLNEFSFIFEYKNKKFRESELKYKGTFHRKT